MTTATDTLHIVCQEKGRDDVFEADVATDCTGAEVLRGLVEAGYLAAPTAQHQYELINPKTGKDIPSGQTLQDAAVENDDVLKIASTHHGA